MIDFRIPDDRFSSNVNIKMTDFRMTDDRVSIECIFIEMFYMTGYKKLAAWQKSMLLVKLVYDITKQYPKEEIFSLTSQTKRAAISIPANIAEGCGRRTKKDTLQFLYISRASLYELETHLNIALMIEVLSKEKFNNISALTDECLKILNGLINKYETDKSLQ